MEFFFLSNGNRGVYDDMQIKFGRKGKRMNFERVDDGLAANTVLNPIKILIMAKLY